MAHHNMGGSAVASACRLSLDSITDSRIPIQLEHIDVSLDNITKMSTLFLTWIAAGNSRNKSVLEYLPRYLPT